MNHIDLVKSYLLDFQKRFCDTMAQLDGSKTFLEDAWQRPQGGGGISRVIEHGKVFEKGGANFSHVFGDNLPASATAHRPELAGASFNALGVSIVMHPQNPFVPTSHANVRLFEATLANGTSIWWFGGGFDLTPYYANKEDCVYWHEQAKAACAPFGSEVYPRFKKWCDEYFYLKHRDENRGIGGLFFDDLNEWNFETCFAFMQSVAEHYLKAYAEIVARRKNDRFEPHHRDFQLYRRGRYVEFNLLYDRGTLFGLQSGGRTESILMSLPAEVHWKYNWQPESNTPEAELTEYYLKPRDWL